MYPTKKSSLQPEFLRNAGDADLHAGMHSPVRSADPVSSGYAVPIQSEACAGMTRLQGDVFGRFAGGNQEAYKLMPRHLFETVRPMPVEWWDDLLWPDGYRVGAEIEAGTNGVAAAEAANASDAPRGV